LDPITYKGCVYPGSATRSATWTPCGTWANSTKRTGIIWRESASRPP